MSKPQMRDVATTGANELTIMRIDLQKAQSTIAEMREALQVLNDASKRVHNTHNGHVACTAKNCAAKDALIKTDAILAKYPQKGK